jgi:hypothetical protein
VDLLQDATLVLPPGRTRIVLCLAGTVSAGTEVLQPGEAALLAAEEPQVQVRTGGRAVVARDADGVEEQRG